jgi:copper chaperone
MNASFEISGMHCGACVARVTRALQTIDPGVQVTLEPPRAQFSLPQLTLQDVQAALARAGDYQASAAD